MRFCLNLNADCLKMDDGDNHGNDDQCFDELFSKLEASTNPIFRPNGGFIYVFEWTTSKNKG